MASHRSVTEIIVDGLDQLNNAKTAQDAYTKSIEGSAKAARGLKQAQGDTTSATSRAISITNNFISVTNNASTSVQNFASNLNRSQSSAKSLMSTFLGFNVVNRAFSESIQLAEKFAHRLDEIERGQARVSRVSTPAQMPILRAAMMQEASRTGADIKDISEGFYQFGTRIKDTNTLLAANRVALNLLIGTESDMRQTARLMIQVHEQFGEQLGKNITQAKLGEEWASLSLPVFRARTVRFESYQIVLSIYCLLPSP